MPWCERGESGLVAHGAAGVEWVGVLVDADDIAPVEAAEATRLRQCCTGTTPGDHSPWEKRLTWMSS